MWESPDHSPLWALNKPDGKPTELPALNIAEEMPPTAAKASAVNES